MRCPSAFELVVAWEKGLRQPPVERALTLLAAACSETRDELANLSIGARDVRLLELYEHVFGERLDAFAECPVCGERLEYSFTRCDLQLGHALPDSATEFEATQGETRLRLRLPTSEDLLALTGHPEPASAPRVLAERCVVEAFHNNDRIARQALSDEDLALAASRLQEADPAGDQLVLLCCSACSHVWQVVLDMESFLWAKLNSLAKRLLTEVHVLARAYGWTEREVLALGPARRQFYLEMVA
ncbi:MAG TPA: hypothetical protein VMG82_28230 [Candidatus Sulfotelmatobacter sp.]|nr:hypothetical protein [Candidatus Sulfotelmatobacter sp.]